MKKAMIYVHGKGGSYLEAEQFKNICLDFDVFGVDYNDYFPWIVKNEIMEVYDKISEKYDYIYVLANSIGAYFTMHTLQNFKIEKALFISPILELVKGQKMQQNCSDRVLQIVLHLLLSVE